MPFLRPAISHILECFTRLYIRVANGFGNHSSAVPLIPYPNRHPDIEFSNTPDYWLEMNGRKQLSPCSYVILQPLNPTFPGGRLL